MPVPAPPPAVPAVVARFAAGRPVRAVWANELGGVTFRVGPGSPRTEFIKVADADDGDFAGEAERIAGPTLRWRRCRWAGTIRAAAGTRNSSMPTASTPTRRIDYYRRLWRASDEN